MPLSSSATSTPNAEVSAASVNSTARPIAHVTNTGTIRQSSHSARATRRRSGGR